MAPRNNDADTSYHKKNCRDEGEIDIQNLIPNLMHKKHKVVKLVKCQLRKIHEEGLLELDENGPCICDSGKCSPTCKCKSFRRSKELQSRYKGFEESRTTGFRCCFYTLAFFLTLFLLILLIIWISSGPLSNSIAHTPIPRSSFVRTDGSCSLEKKYLLRWSNSE